MAAIRMDGGRNELSEFLARIFSIIFPTLPVSSVRLFHRSIRSWIVSRRVFRALSRVQSGIPWYTSDIRIWRLLVFRYTSSDIRRWSLFFSKERLDINLGSGAINFQYSPFSNRFPMRLIRFFMMKIIRNNDPLEQQSSWISSDRFVICELLKS